MARGHCNYLISRLFVMTFVLIFATLSSAAAFVAVVSGATVKALPGVGGALVNETPGFNYNCKGKADGNYPHPSKCTHYVACVAQEHAYEMVCALNHDGNPLHYVAWSGPDPVTSRCDYPEVAGCAGGCKLV